MAALAVAMDTPVAAVALSDALARAQSGLSWEYPCLVWMTDYLRDATGHDPAAAWRGTAWNEATAKRELAKLALLGVGKSAVDRAMDALAKQNGWIEADVPMQGAIMVGVFDIDGEGFPAIFDGQDKWIASLDGRGWTITGHRPDRMWEIR